MDRASSARVIPLRQFPNRIKGLQPPRQLPYQANRIGLDARGHGVPLNSLRRPLESGANYLKTLRNKSHLGG
jgi:hypothetical protein